MIDLIEIIPKRTNLRRFRDSAAFTFCWVLAGGISEFFHYCPSIEDIELPTRALHFDNDYPKFYYSCSSEHHTDDIRLDQDS